MEASSMLTAVNLIVLAVFALVSVVPASIFTEGLSELISKSNIFSKVRGKIKKDSFVGELIRCGYCVSVWASIFPAVVYGYVGYLLLSSIPASIGVGIFFWLYVHRVSNYVHNVNDKYLDKYYSNNKDRD